MLFNTVESHRVFDHMPNLTLCKVKYLFTLYSLIYCKGNQLYKNWLKFVPRYSINQ